MKKLTIPSIANSEFTARFRRAQALARKHGYDALLVNSTEADFANVRYFSNYWPLFEIAGVLIPATGNGALLIGPESETFAGDRSKLKTIFKMVEYRESADPAYPGVPVKSFAEVFAAVGVPAPRRIGVGGYLVTTMPVMDGLRAAFPKAGIVRADHVMVELRSIKSVREIACLRKAFAITEIATQKVLDQIKPGLTELQVAGLAQAAIFANGAESEGLPQYVMSGPNTRHAISRASYRVLRRNEMVQLNLSARVAGYSASVGLPVWLGKMPAKVRDVVQFGLDAHQQTIGWLKAGVIAADVARRYKRLFADRGYGQYYLYGPCHGIGMIEVEPPWMEEISEYPLAANMTFQVDTFLCAERFGLRWENGVRVTRTGVELLSGKFRHIVEV